MSKKDKDTDNFLDKGHHMEVDGHRMTGMDADDMPEYMGQVFKALIGGAADTIQLIHARTELSVEECFMILMAAQGALYARMSHIAGKGQAPAELGDWKGNDAEGIEAMVRTFRVNARQDMDGINDKVKKGDLQ